MRVLCVVSPLFSEGGRLSISTQLQDRRSAGEAVQQRLSPTNAALSLVVAVGLARVRESTRRLLSHCFSLADWVEGSGLALAVYVCSCGRCAKTNKVIWAHGRHTHARTHTHTHTRTGSKAANGNSSRSDLVCARIGWNDALDSASR